MHIKRLIYRLFRRVSEAKSRSIRDPNQFHIRETQRFHCPPEAQEFARALLSITPEESAAAEARWQQWIRRRQQELGITP